MTRRNKRNNKKNPNRILETKDYPDYKFLFLWRELDLFITSINISYYWMASSFLKRIVGKISLQTIEAIYSILITLAFGSCVITLISVIAIFNSKWTKRFVFIKFAFSVFLSFGTAFIFLYVSNFPEATERLFNVTFPSINKQTSRILSTIITFLTSGGMGLITNILLSVISNYIYDYLKQKRANKSSPKKRETSA